MRTSHTPSYLTIFWLAFLLNFVAQAAHEAGHWAVYQFGGHRPTWSFIRLAQTGEQPLHPNEWLPIVYSDGEQGWLRLGSPLGSRLEEGIASAAGPLMSLLVAVSGLALSVRSRHPRWRTIGLILALVTAFGMGAYYLRSPMRTGGDEADVASLIGIPKAALEIPLGLAFLACFVIALRQLDGWRTRLGWAGVIIIASVTGGILLMQIDPIVIAQVDQGNPFFQPVLGYSLPVLLFNGLAVLALWRTAITMKKVMRET